MISILPNDEHNIQEVINDYAKHIGKWFDENYYDLENLSRFSFKSNIWFIRESYTNNKRLKIDYSYCNNVVYHKNDCILMKCFLASMLLDGYAPATVYDYYVILKQIYTATRGLTQLANLSDDEVKQYCTANEKEFIYIPLKYIDFILENYFYDKKHNYLFKAKNKLMSIYISSQQGSSNRDLPSSTDIIAFQYYLNQFELTVKDKNLKHLFYPILIWWKLSIMIPIRPSEITYNLEKDCVFQIGDACYIRLNRIKGNLVRSLQIPIAKRLCISKDIYELIKNYQELVAYDANSVTLFSMDFLRKSFMAVREKEELFFNKSRLFIRNYNNYTHFEGTDLNQLIDLFYEYYIDRKNGSEKNYRRLRAGDTRHLAFSSLLLQNINPIDIAMIGGHTSLNSLSSYVDHIDLYIDSEVYRYYNKLDLNTDNYRYRLKNIIMNMPFHSPDNIIDAIPDEYSIGYCTDNAFSCEDDICFFCTKWWCRPTQENFIKAKNYVSERCISQVKNKLNTDKKMLYTLLNKANTEVVNGEVILKEEYYSQYRQLIKSITSNASRIEALKEALITNFDTEEITNE